MPRYTNDPARNPGARTTHDPTIPQSGVGDVVDAGTSSLVLGATGLEAISSTGTVIVRLPLAGPGFQDDAFQPDAFQTGVAGAEVLVDQGTSDAVLRQPHGGYPFQLDAFQLDAFATGAGSEAIVDQGISTWRLFPVVAAITDSGEVVLHIVATGTSEAETPTGGGIVRSSRSQFRPMDLRQRGTVTITLIPSGTSTLEWAFEDEDELLLLI
jgi:hypothetical protein